MSGKTHMESAGLSVAQLAELIDEHYAPREEGEKRWYRCQRSTDNGGICNRNVYHPTGIVAHENYHQIAGGGNSIFDELPMAGDSSDDPPSDREVDEEILEEIREEFDEDG